MDAKAWKIGRKIFEFGCRRRTFLKQYKRDPNTSCLRKMALCTKIENESQSLWDSRRFTFDYISTKALSPFVTMTNATAKKKVLDWIETQVKSKLPVTECDMRRQISLATGEDIIIPLKVWRITATDNHVKAIADLLEACKKSLVNIGEIPGKNRNDLFNALSFLESFK